MTPTANMDAAGSFFIFFPDMPELLELCGHLLFQATDA